MSLTQAVFDRGRLRRRLPGVVVVLCAMSAGGLPPRAVERGVPPAAAQSASARQVARLTVQGLFPVTPPFLPTGPQLVLYADGTVLVLDPALPTVAPQVWPYRSGRVEAGAVESLLARAGSLGLLANPTRYPPPDPRQTMSHPPRTTVVITTSSGTFRHVADGLSATDTDARRIALRRFAGELSALGARDRTNPYPPTRVGLVAAAVATTGARGIVEWPAAGIPLAAATTCTPVVDPSTIAFLTRHPAGTTYRQGGKTYRIAARVLLPGGDDC